VNAASHCILPKFSQMSEDSWSAPVFTVPLYNVQAYDGHSATMECHVTGKPRPSITWAVDGTEIRASTDFRMSYEDTTGRCALVIDDVLPEDEGQYSVTAVNEAGKSSSSAYLTVLRESISRLCCEFKYNQN
jgi:titin